MAKSVDEILNTAVSDRSDAASERLAVDSLQTAEHTQLSPDEQQANLDEKLAAIKRAIEKGDYDTDAIFDKALTRMLQRLEEPDSEQ